MRTKKKKGIGQFKNFQTPYLESNPEPPALRSSASTHTTMYGDDNIVPKMLKRNEVVMHRVC